MNSTTEALIIIPDITGFTRFMTETNIEFSKKIIPPLLREIISSNKLDLHIAEIEGDAILFFRHDPLPLFKDLIEQCKIFHSQFKNTFEELKSKYNKNFQKLYPNHELGLKIIAHFGEVVLSNIEGKNQLMGEAVITAHKLLKNAIMLKEYLLLSDILLSRYTDKEIKACLNGNKLIQLSDDYDYIGTVSYQYTLL